MIGTTVSHYRIVATLGAGGMGVVYKAEDLKLTRSVALKFLPPDRTHDRQVVERFMREARTASALNHPGICTIYEIDEYEGAQFIAMELLEGDPLDRRIGGRPLSIGTVLDWGIQLADALDAAHAQGVLHRDIKPANIYITIRGQAKILDFGLAKLVDAAPASGGADVSITQLETQLLTTKQGTAMGTVAYMSPEQARGEELDVRTDLFSFGLVLYEMATGQRTFDGSTSALVFDAILNREPRAPIELNANVPPSLERVIAKCLQKDRAVRYQSAAAIRDDLQQVRRERESGTVAARTGTVAIPAISGSSWPSGSQPAAAPATQPTAVMPAAVGQSQKTGPLGRHGAIIMAALGVLSLGATVFLIQRSDQSQESAVLEAPVDAAAAEDTTPSLLEGGPGAVAGTAVPAAGAPVTATPATPPTPTGAAAPAGGARGATPAGTTAAARGVTPPAGVAGARAGGASRGGEPPAAAAAAA
ncbi:MAG: serine/threonine protein kinase, partial [Acidobacteria bacterium]|nr:serine/threonine protein kinase [Acidobacteriota bacterium]